MRIRGKGTDVKQIGLRSYATNPYLPLLLRLRPL